MIKYRIVAVLFLWCAYVQINDPDPYLWIFVYLIGAVTFEFAARNIVFPKISLAIAITCVLFALYLFPDSFDGFSGDMNKNPNIEFARESAGLFLIAISQFALYFLRQKTEMN